MGKKGNKHEHIVAIEGFDEDWTITDAPSIIFAAGKVETGEEPEGRIQVTT